MAKEHSFRRSTLSTEWPLFCLLILVFATLLGYLNILSQPDRRIYDWLSREATRPATPDIVLIAIDDHSLSTLGRWPWPRRTHARLLQMLTEGDARAVGLDIILSEEGSLRGEGEDDRLLAAALAANGRTALPVMFERGTAGMEARLPLPRFASAAAGLGYTHFSLDIDGVVRRVDLQEAAGGQWWPQFAWSIYRVGHPDGALPKVRRPAPSSEWLQAQPMRIPYAGPPGHFRTVSYVDVLTGQVPAAEFAGKYVLVGATAPGLSTAFTTPTTHAYTAMTGVEVQANILASLLDRVSIEEASPSQVALFSVLASLLSLVFCRYLSPLRALLATAILAGAVIIATWLAYCRGGWLPPSAAFISVIVVYPLWNWRRLEATLAFLGDEFARLNREATILLGREVAVKNSHGHDYLERRIVEMHLAALRARDVQRFVINSLDSLPDATLVLSPKGKVVLYNRSAEQSLGLKPEREASLDVTEALAGVHTLSQEAGRANWRGILLQSKGAGQISVEARDNDGREYLIKAAESRQPDGTLLGYIVSLIDVSALRAAERVRDESLRFISHDMRAPQASILALLELQKNPVTAFTQEEFFARIEKSVQATLVLADDFVHLAKAESAPYHFQDADLPSILSDAVDDMWAYARSRDVKVAIDAEIGNEWVSVDRSLMVRAFGNLISNAIKFSPAGGEVACRITMAERDGRRYIACDVKDRGTGIPREEQARIFSPFARGNRTGREGVGLGLVFVKKVVERHGGSVRFHSAPGEGTVFTVELPCVTESLDGQEAA